MRPDNQFARANPIIALKLRPNRPVDPVDSDGGLIHEQVYRRVQQLIISGVFKQGGRIASSRALADSLNISRNSILTALDRLVADGWLESRPRSGLYVAYSGPVVKKHVWNETPDSREKIPFALGWPSDVFPVEIWNRLQTRCWRKAGDNVLGQGDRNGRRALREAIAAHVALTRGVGCSPGQVVVATCIPAAIELAIKALGLSGTEFWVEDPGCRSTSRTLIRSGVKVVPIEVDESGMDVQEGMRTAPRAAGALTTAACQAPTGATLTKGRRHQLAEWARRTGAWIFEDDFNWNGDGSSKPAAPYATYDPDRTIYFNSFNNLLFPGLRIAYLISPPGLVDAFDAIHETEGDVNSANQVVLAEFMASGHFHAHLRRLNECNSERRAALLDCVERELCGYLVPKRTMGGYFICGVEKKSETEVLKRCAAHNLMVTGISAFHPTPEERNEVVLGFSQFQPAVLRHAAIEMRAALRWH